MPFFFELFLPERLADFSAPVDFLTALVRFAVGDAVALGAAEAVAVAVTLGEAVGLGVCAINGAGAKARMANVNPYRRDLFITFASVAQET